MAKIEINPVQSGNGLELAINDRLQLIEDTFNDNVLWRDGFTSEENSMHVDLDMNQHVILNAADIQLLGLEGGIVASIQQNADDIATNAANISTNEGNITANTNQIVINTTNIGTNTAAIAAEEAARIAADALKFDKVGGPISGPTELSYAGSPIFKVYSPNGGSTGIRLVSLSGGNASIDVTDNAGAWAATFASLTATGAATFPVAPASSIAASGATELMRKGEVDTEVAAAKPLTTKGDIYGYDTALARIPVGADTFVLTADSVEPLGVKWAAGGGGFTSPLTTKGDLIGYDTADNRVPIGTNGQVLTADSTEALGLKWDTIPAGFTSPLTTKGDIHVYTTADARLPIGTDAFVLTADSAEASGMKWAAAAGGGGVFTEDLTYDVIVGGENSLAGITTSFITDTFAAGTDVYQYATGSQTVQRCTLVGHQIGFNLNTGAIGLTAVGAFSFEGHISGRAGPGDYCTGIGYQSGAHAKGAYNFFGGYRSGFGVNSGWTGTDNVAIGNQAMALCSGSGVDNNTAVGNEALKSVYTNSTHNCAFGDGALFNLNGSSTYNVGLGANTGNKLFSATKVVCIGPNAGPASGSHNNELFIDYVETNTPLIWGDFANGIIKINGNLQVTEVTFDAETTNTGTTPTIDWTVNGKQKMTVTTATTVTFTAPTGPTNVTLKVINGGTGVITWPATVKWPGGTEPTWTTSGTDIASFYFDGTDYYGAAGLDYS